MDHVSRHAGHHHSTINVKYGYLTFAACIIYAIFPLVYNHISPAGRRSRSSMGRCVQILRGTPVWVHCIGTVVLVTVFSVFKISEWRQNYPIFLKRVGRICYALIPLDVVFALRPNPLTEFYLEYLSLHIWLLRLILVMGFVHGAGFVFKWIVEKAFWEKSLRPSNLAGILVTVLSAVLFLVSIAAFRRRIYSYFYLVHNITLVAFVVLILFHARPPITDFVVLIAALVVFQFGWRLVFSHHVQLEVDSIAGSDLMHIRIAKPGNYPAFWPPGAHLRLHYSRWSPWYYLHPSHPYTISSLPEDEFLELIVKRTTFSPSSNTTYSITRVFASVPGPVLASQRFHVICGGSGILLGLPLVRYAAKSATTKCFLGLTWCVRNRCALPWLPDLLPVKAAIYCTGLSEEPLGGDSYVPLQEEYSMENLPQKLDDVAYHTGRPDFDEVFSELSADPENSQIAVCGPDSLVAEVRRWGKVHRVLVFAEVYEM